MIPAALLLLALPAAAQIPPAPAPSELPGEDGAWAWQRHVFAVGDDGREVEEHDLALRVYTVRPDSEGLLDPGLDWDDARSELEVTDARAWMADGTEVVPGDNSFVPNTPSPLAWAVPYAHLRRLTVAHVGVERGGTVRLAWTVQEREPDPEPFWGVMPLRGAYPVVEQRVELRPGGDLRHAVLHGDAILERSGGAWVLERRDVPSVPTAQVVSGHPVERLAWSDAGSWDEVRDWLGQVVEPACEPGPEVAEQADDVLEPGMHPLDRVRALHDLVVEGVRTVDWPAASTGYRARPAGEVLGSSVGHPLDKAVLLAALLRHGGFEASVAFSAPAAEVAEEVPSLPQLDRVWVVLDQGPHTTWLDPTEAGAGRHDLAGHSVLRLDRQGPLELVPPADPDHNRGALRLVLRLEDGEHALAASGEVGVDLGGSYHPAPGFGDGEGDPSRSALEGVLGAVEGAALDRVSTARRASDLLAARGAWSGGSLDVDRGERVRLDLPRVPSAVTGPSLQDHRQSRAVPLVLPRGPSSERVDLEVEVPGGWTVALAPEPVSVHTPVGSLERTVSLEDGVLRVSEELVLPAGRVETGDWPALRGVLSALERPAGRVVLLVREE